MKGYLVHEGCSQRVNKRYTAHYLVFLLPYGRLTVSRIPLSKGLHRFIRLDMKRR